MTRPNSMLTQDPQPTAVLITVESPTHHEAEAQASLAELTHLLEGLGVEVDDVVSQRRTEPRGPMVLGAGKLEELRTLLEERQDAGAAHLVLVFDGELTPGQQRNLAREFGVEVIDRTQVILRVFSQRARTRIAQLEIELVELEYEAPRIRDDAAVGQKQGGGGGRAAKGHTSVELRKQQLRERVAELRAEIAAAGTMQRARRARRSEVSRVALVGYTNAGKSSWMRALTGADVVVEDALFATLDTTVRALHPPTVPRIVVADTVGFLRRLPNHLLASFRSTLGEALDADLLLIVVDGSDPQWREHLATTQEVLRQVEALDIPSIVLVNKSDRMSSEDRRVATESLPDSPLVSAHSPADVAQVRELIVGFFTARLPAAKLVVPFHLAQLRAEIWAEAKVLDEYHDEAGAHLSIRTDPARLARWTERLRSPGEGAP